MIRTQIRARDNPQGGMDRGTRLRHSRRGLPGDVGGRQSITMSLRLLGLGGQVPQRHH